MKVKDIMSSKIVSVTPEESASVAARLLARHNIGALPVCSKDGRLRGMVTDRDIVLLCVAADEEPSGVKIAEIMTRRVIAVGAEDSVGRATDLMAHEQIRRLPVQSNGKVVGMLSLCDLAKLPNYSAEFSQTLCEISSNLKFL